MYIIDLMSTYLTCEEHLFPPRSNRSCRRAAGMIEARALNPWTWNRITENPGPRNPENRRILLIVFLDFFARSVHYEVWTIFHMYFCIKIAKQAKYAVRRFSDAQTSES